MRWFTILGVCVAGALLGLTACGSGSGSGSSAGSAGKTVTLEAYDNYFTPATITAQAAKKVTLQFKNNGTAEHNFSIKELGVDKDVPVGKSTTVTFTPATAGTLPFFCKYHQTAGMAGSVTVSG